MTDPVDIHQLRPRRGALWELITVDMSRKPATPMASFPQPREQTMGSFTSGRGPDLAIDFGTSAIVVALVGGSHAAEVLHLGEETILPSPFGRRRRLDHSRLTDNYELSFAYLGSGDREHEYYPCLKRRIEWLARCREDREWERDATLDVAAVCQLALDKARDSRDRPLAECLDRDFKTYITVPNAFPSGAIDVLRRGVGYGVAAALRCRRLPAVKSLLEAEAVAYGAIARPTLAQRRDGTTLLVIDAGAGTTDATILRAEAGDLRALAHVGLPVGGMDLDTFLASLKGPFEVAEREGKLSHWLGIARQAKQHHLGEAPAAGVPAAAVPVVDRCRRLAEDLVRNGDWPATHGGRPIAEEIVRVYRRYMALAVHSLIRALPADEVARVDQVVLSGRGSLLAGFSDAVRQTLAEQGPTLVPQCAEDPRDRKLAVVQGVGAYVASTYGSGLDRRPTRSSFEVFLRYENERELTLLKAGHPLVHGWGVAAWHQPQREIGRSSTRPWVGMRLVPRAVLTSLASEDTFDDRDLEDLLSWSVLPLLRIEEQPPPYSNRFAFNFLSLEAQLEVDGKPIPKLDRSVKSFGRQHPVHQLDDNWFELGARSRAPSSVGMGRDDPPQAAGSRGGGQAVGSPGGGQAGHVGAELG